MLLRWVRVALVFRQRERANKFRSGQRWFDYFVDEAPEGAASQGGDGGEGERLAQTRVADL